MLSSIRPPFRSTMTIRIHWTSWLASLTVLLLPPNLLVSAQGDGAGCFNSSFAIIQAQMSPEIPEAFVVCAGTTIQIGQLAQDFSAYTNGDWPLMALRPNVTIKCGESGESSNNCVVISDFIHVLTFPDLPQLGVTGIRTDNLYISGFTFTGGTNMVHQ